MLWRASAQRIWQVVMNARDLGSVLAKSGLSGTPQGAGIPSITTPVDNREPSAIRLPSLHRSASLGQEEL